ncbi:MAG: hypothetical protein FWG14_13215 [Peptococcaceae bacterium]|nr:hypothetical protein [Peptococcaceae bacterium]
MFTDEQMSRAVDLQARSYELLRWVSSAVKKGFISFKAAHNYSSNSSAAEEWIIRHYLNIPEAAKPALEDMKDFSGIFSTYLENSFELVSNPGKHLYSPDAHCFCPICSWLIDAPNLKTRKLTSADKKRAQRMTLGALNHLASEQGVYLSEMRSKAILEDVSLREHLALVTYGLDLLSRMKGVAVGPASLVLWRTFAWLPSGSPKKKFRLSAELLLQAEQAVKEAIFQEA